MFRVSGLGLRGVWRLPGSGLMEAEVGRRKS